MDKGTCTSDMLRTATRYIMSLGSIQLKVHERKAQHTSFRGDRAVGDPGHRWALLLWRQ